MEAISVNFDFSWNPASRLDCEILDKKCTNFIKDSKWPVQNPCKNALGSEGGGGEQS